ncbi:MAG: CHAT domain-containing protein, partial [Rhodospirillales bacterium]
METSDFQQAEKFLHRALAKAAGRKNVSPRDVALVISHLARLNTASGQSRTLPSLLRLLDKLDRANYLTSFDPLILEIFINLVMLHSNISSIEKPIEMMRKLEKFQEEKGIEVPLVDKSVLFTYGVLMNAIAGNQEFFKGIEGKFKRSLGISLKKVPPLHRTAHIGAINARFNSGGEITESDFEYLTKGFNRGKTQAISRLTAFEYFSKQTSDDDQLAEFIDNASVAMIRSSGLFGPNFSHHTEPFNLEKYSREILFRNLASKYSDSLPEKISNSLFNHLVKISALKSDIITRAQIEINSAQDPELSLEIKRHLKFSEERETLSLALANKAVESSIAYAKRGYKYKKIKDPDTFSLEFDYRRINIDLRRSKRIIDEIDKKLINRITRPEVSLSLIRGSLRRGEAFYFYELSQNYIFSCLIKFSSSSCKIRNFNRREFAQNLSTVRDSLTSVPRIDPVFPVLSSQFLYKNIFGLSLYKSNFKKLYLKPSGEHLNVPFNALVEKFDGRSLYLGLKQPIVITASVSSMLMIPKQITDGYVSSKYLGMGDPLYDDVEVVKPEGIFAAVRGGMGAPNLTNLNNLPATRQEIMSTSENIYVDHKKILLGKNATEVNFRLLDHKSYKLMHFATHGLVS